MEKVAPAFSFRPFTIDLHWHLYRAVSEKLQYRGKLVEPIVDPSLAVERETAEPRAARESRDAGWRDIRTFLTGQNSSKDGPAGSVKYTVAPTPSLPSAHTRPPCRSTTRCTVASPTPVPENSISVCNLWNGLKSLSTYFMLKPDPLSRMKYTISSLRCSDRNSILATATFAENFQALPKRLSSAMRIRRLSASTTSPSSISQCTVRPKSFFLNSETTACASAERSTALRFISARPTRERSSMPSISSFMRCADPRTLLRYSLAFPSRLSP